MNLPNVLTLSRIVLAIVLVFLLEENSSTGNISAFIVFMIASLTDFYDGHLAKTKGLVSNFGKIMDPVADKILLLSAFGALAHTHAGLVPWWIFIVIAIREIMVTVSRFWAMRQGQVLAAERAGKMKTLVQIIAVSAILLYLVLQQPEYCFFWFHRVQSIWAGVNYELLILAVILTVYSGIDYFLNKSKINPSS